MVGRWRGYQKDKLAKEVEVCCASVDAGYDGGV